MLSGRICGESAGGLLLDVCIDRRTAGILTWDIYSHGRATEVLLLGIGSCVKTAGALTLSVRIWIEAVHVVRLEVCGYIMTVGGNVGIVSVVLHVLVNDRIKVSHRGIRQ